MPDNSKHLELKTADGPWVEVGSYEDQAVIRFDWHGPNQRWYLAPDEAVDVAVALLRAAGITPGVLRAAGLSPEALPGWAEHTAAAIRKIAGA